MGGAVAGPDESRDTVRPWLSNRYCAIVSVIASLIFCACLTAAVASAVSTEPTQAQPTVIHVALVIRNLAAIDEVKENWQVTGLLVAKWNDPRLTFRQRPRGQPYRDLPGTAWKPGFDFTNEVTPTNFRFVDLYYRPDGTVVYAQAFNATLSTNLDLRRFPFDSEVLPVVVQARGDDIDRTIVKSNPAESSFANQNYAGLAQWVPISLSERLVPVAGSASNANAVEFGLKVRRNPNSYIWKFIIPLVLLVIISWITFWLSHEEFKTKDQLQSAVATLLIIVAFNITATSSLPRTEYITYIDALLFTCFIFVVISIATIVGIHLLQLNRSAERALPLRRLAGVILPIAFVITQAILFFTFHIGG
ncbi:MAG TPA: hypothetical protein VHR97_13380 [Candidatus Baltobacteraceae bacterium]|nr:hypothetical protein [Candidatus Baltobacteraceae bacterium]